MHWLGIILSLLFMACFAILFLSIIFDWYNVRTDLLKHEGSIQVEDWFNVSGVALVTLLVVCAALAAFPLIFLAPDAAIIEICNKEKKALSKEIDRFMDNQFSEEKAVTWVGKLKPDDSAAKQILLMAREKKGPWELLPSVVIKISVPGSEKEKGRARGCYDYYGKTLQLFDPEMSNSPEGRAVTVEVKDLMFKTKTCREAMAPIEKTKQNQDREPFDLKINCGDANVIFGDSVLRCDPDGKPKWNGNHRILSVRASLGSIA